MCSMAAWADWKNTCIWTGKVWNFPSVRHQSQQRVSCTLLENFVHAVNLAGNDLWGTATPSLTWEHCSKSYSYWPQTSHGGILIASIEDFTGLYTDEWVGRIKAVLEWLISPWEKKILPSHTCKNRQITNPKCTKQAAFIQHRHNSRAACVSVCDDVLPPAEINRLPFPSDKMHKLIIICIHAPRDNLK